MHIILRLLLPLVATAVGYVLLQLAEILYQEFLYPLRRLPSPKNPSFIFGHFKELEDDPAMTRKWRYELGPTFWFKGVFNTRELYIADTAAIDHILKNKAVYQKRSVVGSVNSRIVGQGLLGVEGDDHTRQRRVMNPAFGTIHIRSATTVFLDKSYQLRDVLAHRITPGSQPTRLNVLSWLSRMTLDVIGLSGFGHQFDLVRGAELILAFERLMQNPSAARDGILRMAQQDVPLLRLLHLPGRNEFQKARKQLLAMGNKLVKESKTADGRAKSESSGRDLLSILIRANMDPDIPERQRMSDAEVAGQIPTFLLAGHATTSTAISWALHELSINQRAQTKLRNELLTLATDSPTLEQLETLPYLESVIRETLRVHPPVGHTLRIAMAEDVVPLRTPCVDRSGEVHNTLTIPKGQIIRVPIRDVNTDTTLWGQDAAEFRPERWDALPDAVHAMPGVWANILTFLAGPHHCIGFRFSLAEQKALLFLLIRAFEFAPAVPAGAFRTSSGGLQAPFVRSEMGTGPQMPLLVRAYGG
ncbi:cytochrome P450 monooxygenase [Mycena galericulata]|nr:cytochrome P450 monooxygenase [Mycena galericulata]